LTRNSRFSSHRAERIGNSTGVGERLARTMHESDCQRQWPFTGVVLEERQLVWCDGVRSAAVISFSYRCRGPLQRESSYGPVSLSTLRPDRIQPRESTPRYTTPQYLKLLFQGPAVMIRNMEPNQSSVAPGSSQDECDTQFKRAKSHDSVGHHMTIEPQALTSASGIRPAVDVLNAAQPHSDPSVCFAPPRLVA
jgi:hypothetical protein